jgi:hypothetical protein
MGFRQHDVAIIDKFVAPRRKFMVQGSKKLQKAFW